MTTPERTELHELLAALVDGELSESQQTRLGELLTGSAEARDLYLDHLALHADLGLPGSPVAAESRRALSLPTAAGAPSAGSPTAGAHAAGAHAAAAPSLATRWGGWHRWAGWATAAAALLLMAAGWAGRPGPTGAAEPEIARLEWAESATWSDAQAPTEVGRPLPVGRAELTAGRAAIRMSSGAVLTLVAPARIELLDAKSVRLLAGTVSVDVPESALGFRIVTPTADVVDLGTRFGVAVEADGSTEIHVARGVVVARPAGGGVLPILAREAGRIQAEIGDVTAVRFDGERFPNLLPDADDSAVPSPTNYPPLPEGARVVFLGDKATDRETHLLLANQALAALPPAGRPKLFNAAVAFRFTFREDNYRQQVLSLRPTHAVLEFGSELASQAEWSADKFADQLAHLIERLRADGIEPILTTGFPLEGRLAGHQPRLDEYNRRLTALAAEKRLRLADYAGSFRAWSRHPQRLAEDLVTRGERPTFEGHRAMAVSVLTAFGYSRLSVADTVELAPLPGVLTNWHYRHRRVGEHLSDADAAAVRPDESWTTLTLPMSEDDFARRLADSSHSITYRDRARGYATDLYRPGFEGVVATTVVTADVARKAVLNTGATVRAVWLNGQRVVSIRSWQGWHPGAERVEVLLRAGENRIVIEAGSSFFLSLTETRDWPLPAAHREAPQR